MKLALFCCFQVLLTCWRETKRMKWKVLHINSMWKNNSKFMFFLNPFNDLQFLVCKLQLKFSLVSFIVPQTAFPVFCDMDAGG